MEKGKERERERNEMEWKVKWEMNLIDFSRENDQKYLKFLYLNRKPLNCVNYITRSCLDVGLGR